MADRRALIVFVAGRCAVRDQRLNADGLDLRGSSVTDLDTVVRQERERADDLQRESAALQSQVQALGKSVDDEQVGRVQSQVDALKGPAGLEPVHGPASP